MCTKDYFEIGYWFTSLFILGATVYYIATGPVTAVRIGRRLNNEQQKDNAKRNLFLLLFSLRGSPVHYDFVRGLNQIDIVFEDVPTVIQAWKDHRKSLDNKKQANAEDNWKIERIRVLSEMARSLGYVNINQTDMMMNYYPEGHENQYLADQEVRDRFVDFLKKNFEMNSLIVNQIRQEQSPPPGDSNSIT